MPSIFYNVNESRLRSGWRILITITLLLILLIITSPLYDYGLIVYIWQAVAVLGVMWFASHFLDKRPFADYGFQMSVKWMRDALIGCLVAAVAMLLIFATQFYLGWVTVDQIGADGDRAVFWSGILMFFVMMIAVGVWEEAFFRGFLLTNMQDGFQTKYLDKKSAMLIAVLITSGIFGLLHMSNPNATMASGLNITIAGMVLAYPFVVTGSLAIPIGIHFSWNFFQGAVFGFPVSGIENQQSLVMITQGGPEMLTGGAFGPEAGITGLAGLLLILILTEIYMKSAVMKNIKPVGENQQNR